MRIHGRDFALALVFLGFFAQTALPAPAQIRIKEVSQGTLVFEAPEGTEAPAPLKTKIHDLEVLQTVQVETEALPYFLLRGKRCASCADESELYLVRADGFGLTTFVEPGKVWDAKKGDTLLESRAFVGQCLKNKGPAYVVYQRERLGKRRGLTPSVFVAEITTDGIREQLIGRLRDQPRIEHTLKLVKKGDCKEIAGRARKTTKFDIRNVSDEEEPDDDKTEKNPASENSTEKPTEATTPADSSV